MGLDAAGKTTILYKLKLGEIVTTIPTIGAHTCRLRCEQNVSRVGAGSPRVLSRLPGCTYYKLHQIYVILQLQSGLAWSRSPIIGLDQPAKVELLLAGFNVETVEYKNISFTVWDVGGQDKVCCCPCSAPTLSRSWKSRHRLTAADYACRFARSGGTTSRIRKD